MPKDISRVPEIVLWNYNNWSGRWAVHTIYAFAFPHIDLLSINYNLLIALSAPIWCLIFYIFLHILFRKSLDTKQKVLFAILLCAIYWVGIPDAGNTWYWLTGSTEYQLPFLVMSLSLLVLTGSWITGAALLPKIGGVILGVALAFLVTGLHEIAGLLLFGCLAVGSLFAITRKRWDVAGIYVLTMVVIAGGLILNLSAPGDAIRAVIDYPNANNPAFAVRALISPRTSPIGWLGDARLLCLTVLLLTTPAFLKLRPEWTTWKLPLPGPLSSMAVAVPMIALAAVTGGAFVVAFAQGMDVPPRVLNLLYATLIIGWVASLIPAAGLIGAHVQTLGQTPVQTPGQTPGPIFRAVNLGAAILLPVTLLIAPNTLQSVNDLATVRPWRSALDAQFADISRRAAAGEKNVVVKPIGLDPKTYSWNEIGPDPEYWENLCLAVYFDLATIHAEPPPPPIPPPKPNWPMPPR